MTQGRVAALEPAFLLYPEAIREQVATDALYSQYLDRQSSEVEALRRDEVIEIPSSMDYANMPGLSSELRHKLERRRPGNLAEAGRIEGVTPAALTLILANCRRASRAVVTGQ